MIKSVRIQNFQGHEDTYIEFHPGVNVFIGQSDSGKSSVIRALEWVINNKPDGDAFRSDWGGETLVTLEVDDHKVTRVKGKGERANLYILDDQKFKAFNKGVPDEIQQVININEINWQGQFDSPFLLSRNAGEVARQLNQVSNLSIIDTAISNASMLIRNNHKSIEDDLSISDDLQEKIDSYDYLEEFENDLSKLEKKNHELENVRQKIVSIKYLIHDISETEIELKRIRRITKLEGLVDKLLSQFESRKTIRSKIARLQDLISKITACKKHMVSTKRITKLQPAIKSLLSKQKKLSEIRQQKNLLQGILNEMSGQNNLLIKTRQILVKSEYEFRILMPDECPLCGSNLKGAMKLGKQNKTQKMPKLRP